MYEVRVTSATFSNVYTYDSDVEKATIDSLEPSTRYEVRLTLVVHGGATISSDTVAVTTLDGSESDAQTFLDSQIGQIWMIWSVLE